MAHIKQFQSTDKVKELVTVTEQGSNKSNKSVSTVLFVQCTGIVSTKLELEHKRRLTRTVKNA